MTEIHDLMSIAVVGLVLILIFVALIENISTESPKEIQQKLTPPLVLQLLNENTPIGPVAVRMQTLGNSYVYEITAKPKLKLLGEHEDMNIIPVLRFKGHSVHAKVVGSSGERDTFTIKSDEDTVSTDALKGTITSDIKPIAEYKIYSDFIEEGTQIMIRNDKKGTILASVFVSRKEVPYVPEIVERQLFVCEVVFSFECKTDKKYTIPPLYGHSDEGPPSDYKQSITLCDGTAKVEIYDTREELKQHCSEERVRADISYENGEEWEEAGETVFISFWRETDCTRKNTDFGQLLTNCQDDVICPEQNPSCQKNAILGGEFELNAGIIRVS